MGVVIKTSRDSALDEGVWADYNGSKFLIAHTSNLKFQREMARLQAPFRKQIEKGSMDPEDSKNIVCKALAAHVLKDWKNVADQEGTDVKYTRELGVIALQNDEGLREFVQEFSTELANFREQETEEKGKP